MLHILCSSYIFLCYDRGPDPAIASSECVPIVIDTELNPEAPAESREHESVEYGAVNLRCHYILCSVFLLILHFEMAHLSRLSSASMFQSNPCNFGHDLYTHPYFCVLCPAGHAKTATGILVSDRICSEQCVRLLHPMVKNHPAVADTCMVRCYSVLCRRPLPDGIFFIDEKTYLKRLRGFQRPL